MSACTAIGPRVGRVVVMEGAAALLRREYGAILPAVETMVLGCRERGQCTWRAGGIGVHVVLGVEATVVGADGEVSGPQEANVP